jgi:hypothetical protein
MSWNEILVAFGGVAGIAAALAVFAKLVAEKSAEAALKRFEHTHHLTAAAGRLRSFCSEVTTQLPPSRQFLSRSVSAA